MSIKEVEVEKQTLPALQNSINLYQNACQYIPGGVSANIKYFAPHPIFMEKAQQSYLLDVDGNRYIDYLLCYGALIAGHGHERVMTAVQKQWQETGTTVFGAPHRIEVLFAEKIVSLFPGMDQVRFTNSGLEATLLSMRLAKAYTGKKKMAKFEGHYHGGYNEVLFSINPDVDQAGKPERPGAVPESMGLTNEDIDQTIILPFNHIEATEQLLRQHAHELAAVILEPVQGGFIPATSEFMSSLRDITKRLGIILIFDEVKTGFRVSVGGAQNKYEIIPDLTALGKVLGGGLPIGAVGGHKELMELMSPTVKADVFMVGPSAGSKQDVLFHSGTYNGHPTVLAAGLATIELLEEENRFKHLVERTNNLRKGLEKLYHNFNVPMQTLGLGSMFNIVLTDQKVQNYRDLQYDQPALRSQLDYSLLNKGVYTKPMNRYSLSIVHTDEDIKATVKAHKEALEEIRN